MSSLKGNLPSEELLRLANEFENELNNNILPFWLTYASNPSGGFYGEVSTEGVGDPNAVRASLLCSRILWTFSSAYLRYKDETFLALADFAFKELEGTFWDKERGGVFWSVKGNGEKNQTHKQIYAQVFAIYGYSEYFRATGNEQSLGQAKRLYQLIEQHAFDRKYGGYIEWLSEEWEPLPSDLESYLGITNAKSQNTHLHVFEAYTNLLRVWPDAGLKTQLTALIDVVLTKILNPKTSHLVLFMDAEWNVEGDQISYGHDIEAAWLLVDTAEVLQDADLIKRTRELAVKIADVTLAEGMDKDGGLPMEASASQGLTKPDKDWWSQAEALVGFTNAFEITGDLKYLEAVKRSWDFITKHMIHEKGEWQCTLLTSSWAEQPPTINAWKCPYHNGRAMLELPRRLRALASEKSA